MGDGVGEVSEAEGDVAKAFDEHIVHPPARPFMLILAPASAWIWVNVATVHVGPWPVAMIFGGS